MQHVQHALVKKFKQSKDNREMNEICSTSTSDFSLQAQQEFLKEYIRDPDAWDRLLLYHQIGSGKTCTAITLAEEWKRLNPHYKVVVILPARLRTNFIDELVSPCGGERYLDQETFEKYINPKTREYDRKKIRAAFQRAIEKEYSIISFEKWKNVASKHPKGLKAWTKEITKDTLIIVDEVHNLLTNTYDMKKYKDLEKTHKLVSAKGNATMLFKYMTRYAAPNCKMLLMTATPIFDNIGQFRELAESLQRQPVPVPSKISQVIPMIQGKVSYFPGTSPNAYPSVTYTVEKVPLSLTQDKLTIELQLENEEEKDDEKESFMSKQRQIALACSKKSLRDMHELCPKIERAVNYITRHKGAKHLVYSTFVQQGIHVVRDALDLAGWKDVKSIGFNKEDFAEEEMYKVYAIWDGKTKDLEKQKIKALVNGKDNRYGKYIRVVLGSPSMKEGVSFKHIQHMHLLDPMWNVSSKTQVEGRAIRFCSHSEMPLSQRNVNVHIYKSVPCIGGSVEQTCDQIIYDIIMPKKEAQIRAGEHALKISALDHSIFGPMYDANPDNVQYNDEFVTRSKFSKVKTSCPKKRRPFLEKCPGSVPFLRMNPRKDECCYKHDLPGNVSTSSLLTSLNDHYIKVLQKQIDNDKNVTRSFITLKYTPAKLPKKFQVMTNPDMGVHAANVFSEMKPGTSIDQLREILNKI